MVGVRGSKSRVIRAALDGTRVLHVVWVRRRRIVVGCLDEQQHMADLPARPRDDGEAGDGAAQAAGEACRAEQQLRALRPPVRRAHDECTGVWGFGERRRGLADEVRARQAGQPRVLVAHQLDPGLALKDGHEHFRAAKAAHRLVHRERLRGQRQISACYW